jgi:predicted nucleic acid-binding protein
MSAERRSFEDVLESIVYWDATFAIAVFVVEDLFHQECVTFKQRILDEGTTLSVASDFVYNELAFHIIRNALTVESRRRGQHWRDVKRQDPTVVRTAMLEVELKKMEMDRLTLNLPITERVKDHAFQLMRDYALLPTDAYHIAIALDAGINAFATVDADFLNVDGIIVYTCLP